MKHRTNAYKDGYKWIMYCIVCGQEEDEMTTECNGYNNPLATKKFQEKFFSGLPNKD